VSAQLGGAPTPADFDLGPVVAQLAEAIELSDGGMVTALVEVAAPAPADLRAALTAALGAALAPALGVRAGLARLLSVEPGPDAEATLHDLNTSRDSLKRFCPLVLLLCEDGEATRWVRGRTPDLFSAVTVGARLQPRPDPVGAADLWARLAARQREALGTLKLSGLVPHTAAVSALPLATVFVPRLVRPPGGEPRRLTLMVGEPGAGKSTLLKAMALGLTGEGAAEGGRVVPRRLYLALAGWSEENRRRSTPLEAWVCAAAGALIGAGAVEAGALLPGATLLLDGLDEVAGLSERRRLLDEAAAMARAWPTLLIVVSGRELVLEQLLAEHRKLWEVERLAALSPAAAAALMAGTLRAWHGVAAGAALPAEVEARRQRALQSEAFVALRQTPLLVTFYTVLMELQREPPAHVPSLYNALVEMLIVNWQAMRSTTGARLSRAEAYKVLAPLGWGLVEAGVTGLTEPALLERLMAADSLSAPGPEREAAARRRLQQLSEDSALLMVEGGRWRFHHQTIAEFMAARAALQDPAVAAAIEADPYPPQRQQTVAFAVSLALDVEPRDDLAARWLEALSRKAKRRGVYDAKIPGTLSAVLAHARGLPPSRRATLATHLIRVTFHQRLSPWQREVAVGAFARAAALGAIPAEQLEALAANAVAREATGEALMDLVDVGEPQVARFLCADTAVGHTWLTAWLTDPDPRVRLRAWVAALWRADSLAQLVRTHDGMVSAMLEALVVDRIGGPIFGAALVRRFVFAATGRADHEYNLPPPLMKALSAPLTPA
jgi:energy-coupling factor transporter ATP-binding protein EcfA2